MCFNPLPSQYFPMFSLPISDPLNLGFRDDPNSRRGPPLSLQRDAAESSRTFLPDPEEPTSLSQEMVQRLLVGRRVGGWPASPGFVTGPSNFRWRKSEEGISLLLKRTHHKFILHLDLYLRLQCFSFFDFMLDSLSS